MSIKIRPAVAVDQPVITALIRSARLNPRNLQWSNFWVAESEGQIVGVRQVKVHRHGTREVASGFVLPAYRRHGISGQLMQALLAQQTGVLYLLCDQQWTGYYQQFGFQPVSVTDLPADFCQEYRIGQIITTLLTLLAQHKVRIIPLRRLGC